MTLGGLLTFSEPRFLLHKMELAAFPFQVVRIRGSEGKGWPMDGIGSLWVRSQSPEMNGQSGHRASLFSHQGPLGISAIHRPGDDLGESLEHAGSCFVSASGRNESRAVVKAKQMSAQHLHGEGTPMSWDSPVGPCCRERGPGTASASPGVGCGVSGLTQS